MDITLNFGKHAGKHLSEIPLSYVEWLSEQDSIRKQPEAVKAAKAFLAEQVAQGRRPERKYAAPRTVDEAKKYSWMITHVESEYLQRQAKLANLEKRDPDGFICVFDGDDEHDVWDLLMIHEDGTCSAPFFESEEQLRRVLKRYNIENEYNYYKDMIYTEDEEEDYDYYEDIEDQDY